MSIAVIGAVTSGFFVAEELFKRLPGVSLHMYEKRVAPYGLVRYGVSPDHPLTRRVVKMFDQVARREGFHYHGNVEIGKDITMEALEASHHAVVLCTGAELPNRPDIPGARLPGAVDALDIARWVNGEPDAFDARLLNGMSRVVIIGNGNVALDAARMLTRSAGDWVDTDIAPHAMEALIHHRAKHVVIAGRRGPADASFTQAELEEFIALSGWDVQSEEPLPFDILPDKPASDRVAQFIFHATPVRVAGETHVSGVCFRRGSGCEEIVEAQLVVFATGHRGCAVGDWPFDVHSGVMKNTGGRVDGRPGRYVCGWIKRGAKGLIGHNRKDAIETVSCILADQVALANRREETSSPTDLLGNCSKRMVSWSDWKKINAVEEHRGMLLGRPRIALPTSEALALLD